jgi:hypothetical protein
MVEYGKYEDACRPDDVEDEIGEARHDRAPDVTVDDRTCFWKRAYGLEPLADGHEEFFAKARAL